MALVPPLGNHLTANSCELCYTCIFSAALNVMCFYTEDIPWQNNPHLFWSISLLMQVINWILLRPCWKHWPLIFICFLFLLFPSFASHYLLFSSPSLSPCIFFLLHCSSLFLLFSKGERRYPDSGSIIDDDLWLLKLLAPGLELFKVWQSGTPCVLVNGAVPIRQRQPI